MKLRATGNVEALVHVCIPYEHHGIGKFYSCSSQEFTSLLYMYAIVPGLQIFKKY